MRAAVCAAEVDVDHGLPHRPVCFLERGTVGLSRVIHQDVDGAERLFGGLHGGVNGGVVCHINGFGMNAGDGSEFGGNFF